MMSKLTDRKKSESDNCRLTAGHVTTICLLADFYAKVCMMRQNTTVKTRRTDVIKRDVAPKFNESFSFKMTSDVLDVSSIIISVWHSVSALKGCMI